jgi:hypothetical protein
MNDMFFYLTGVVFWFAIFTICLIILYLISSYTLNGLIKEFYTLNGLIKEFGYWNDFVKFMREKNVKNSKSK